MSKIAELFNKDISRHINPAVVVGELKSPELIYQEIEEYVFTTDLANNIYKYLNAITTNQSGKTGIWINGYYGSGKSHFIKFLYYLLTKEYGETAMKEYADFIQNQKDALPETDIGMVRTVIEKIKSQTIEQIIFNIDAETKHKADKDAITWILLNQLNKHRGFCDGNIALAIHLEKPLYEKGVLDDFADDIRDVFGTDWKGNQNKLARRALEKIVEMAKKYDPTIDTASLADTIRRDEFYRIKDLIAEFKDFLKDKDKNYRLIFLIDEVSQYIDTSSSLLLNLQTIIEEIGDACGNRIWMVCTAQQELKSLVDNSDSQAQDYGKILGRFETRISLQSQDASFITKKRILDKTTEANKQLTDFYNQNKVAIQNQFEFNHDHYKNYAGVEDFVLTYPFIPYQFALISNVFKSFSDMKYVGDGVRNTERSILGITHYTTRQVADKDLGYFISFDKFYNDQFKENLLHNASGLIDRAYKLDNVQNDPFARRVANVLFMISNINEVLKINFRATPENIALLLIESLQDNRSQLVLKTKEVLTVMVDKNIIQENDGVYRYMEEDEITVANLITNETVNAEEKCSVLYDEILSQLVKVPQKVDFGSTYFNSETFVDDKSFSRNGDFKVKFVVFDSRSASELMNNSNKNELLICINEQLHKDQRIKTVILDFMKTKKYITANKPHATGTRVQTLTSFASNNATVLRELKRSFEKMIEKSQVIIGTSSITFDSLPGQSMQAKMDAMIQKHLSVLYNKESLTGGFAKTNKELTDSATRNEPINNLVLQAAEEEVINRINMLGNGVSVADIVKEFNKVPYGWNQWATIDVLLSLAQKQKIKFEWNNEEISDLKDFVTKVQNSQNQQSLTILPESGPPDNFKEFVNAVNEIWINTIIGNISDYKAAIDHVRSSLAAITNDAKETLINSGSVVYASVIKEYVNALHELNTSRSAMDFMSKIIAKRDHLRELRDTYAKAKAFAEDHGSKYKEIFDFEKRERNNFSSLDGDFNNDIAIIRDFFEKDTHPWDSFHTINEIHRKLKREIEKKTQDLKNQAKQLYSKAIDDLHTKKIELHIADSNVTLPTKEEVERKIEHSHSISELKLKIKEADDFYTENIQKLYSATQDVHKKETVQVRVSTLNGLRNTIETQDELDEYISALKIKLKLQIDANKIVIIT